MRLLLDTHALIWSLKESARLSPHLKARLADEAPASVSMASLWEIAIKVSMKKLHLPQPYHELFPKSVYDASFVLLPIEPRHLSMVTSLPWHHKDPFDRLIIAQAICDDLVIATCDPIIHRYDVKTIW